VGVKEATWARHTLPRALHSWRAAVATAAQIEHTAGVRTRPLLTST